MSAAGAKALLAAVPLQRARGAKPLWLRVEWNQIDEAELRRYIQQVGADRQHENGREMHHTASTAGIVCVLGAGSSVCGWLLLCAYAHWLVLMYKQMAARPAVLA
jgi:hypothetical protein